MINCIVFDIGNVLLDFNPREYLHEVFSDGKLAAELYNQVFLSEEWLELDRGTLTQQDFIKVISERHPDNAEHIRKCMEHWMDMLTVKEESVKILEKLDNKKYKLLLLSNFHSLAYEFITGKYYFFKCFHGGVISCREKLVKPEGDIYKCLIERYGIEPGNAVFIDDSKPNIEAASKEGLKAIQFKDAKQLLSELKNLGVSFID